MFFLFYPCISLLFILLSSHLIFVPIFNKFLLSSSTSFISSFHLYFSHYFTFSFFSYFIPFFPFSFPFSSPFSFPFPFSSLRLVFFMYFWNLLFLHQLSWEELRHVIVGYGFQFQKEESKECCYTNNTKSMMFTTYRYSKYGIFAFFLLSLVVFILYIIFSFPFIFFYRNCLYVVKI